VAGKVSSPPPAQKHNLKRKHPPPPPPGPPPPIEHCPASFLGLTQQTELEKTLPLITNKKKGDPFTPCHDFSLVA